MFIYNTQQDLFDADDDDNDAGVSVVDDHCEDGGQLVMQDIYVIMLLGW